MRQQLVYQNLKPSAGKFLMFVKILLRLLGMSAIGIKAPMA
jgi:hypothetical protein